MVRSEVHEWNNGQRKCTTTDWSVISLCPVQRRWQTCEEFPRETCRHSYSTWMATAQKTASKLRAEEQQIRSVRSGRCTVMIIFELKCSSFDLALFTNERHGKSSIHLQPSLSSPSNLETIKLLVATCQPWKVRFEKRSSWQWCAPKSTRIGEPIHWRKTGWCDQVTSIDFIL